MNESMRTLVINNQKGGVGKTMLAVHVAWSLSEGGARVLAIDLDPQANASFTLSEAPVRGTSSDLFFETPLEIGMSEPGAVTLLAADRRLDGVDARLSEAVPAFRRQFDALRSRFDYCVIDTPPTWSGRNYAALMVASSLVAPIELETYALQGVRRLLSQKAGVEKAARQGRPIDFLGLLPSRFQSNSPRQREALQALLAQNGPKLLFPEQGLLTHRQGYAEALEQKRPVWTIRKTAAQEAAREIRSVLATIKGRLDGLPG